MPVCPAPNPLWLQALVTAAPALLVGILAWVVSRGQLLVAKEKLRHDLFERRFAIFFAFQNLLIAVAMTEEAKDLSREVVTKLATARFLFDQATFEYLRDTYMAVGTLNNMGTYVVKEENYASKAEQVQAQLKLSADRMKLFDKIDEIGEKVAPQLRLRDFGPQERSRGRWPL